MFSFSSRIPSCTDVGQGVDGKLRCSAVSYPWGLLCLVGNPYALSFFTHRVSPLFVGRYYATHQPSYVTLYIVCLYKLCCSIGRGRVRYRRLSSSDVSSDGSGATVTWVLDRVPKSRPFRKSPWDLWDRKIWMGFNWEKVIIFSSQSLYAPDYTYVVSGFKW